MAEIVGADIAANTFDDSLPNTDVLAKLADPPDTGKIGKRLVAADIEGADDDGMTGSHLAKLPA
jgi:hypothetical protein